MKPIRTGIIGFGRMAERTHLARMRETGLYDLVGVCDITPARRETALSVGLRATDRVDELLSWDIELVVLTTHTALHHPIALEVISAGKHLLIEKPMTVTGQQAEELVSAAHDQGTMLTVFHNRHYDEDYCLVKAAVEEGLLGDLVALENRTVGARPAIGFGVPEYNPSWRVTASAGGGTLLDFGPHWVEQVLDLMAGRRVVQVFADVRHVKWGDADDLFRIDMVFEDGTRAAVAKYDISYYTPPDKWLVMGREATLHGPIVEDGKKAVVICGPDYEIKRTRASETRNLHENIAHHIRDGRPLIITPEHALRVMRVIQAAVDSSKCGKSVDASI